MRAFVPSFLFSTAFFLLTFLLTGRADAKPTTSELPPLVLEEAGTGASLRFDHGCLLDSSAPQAGVCAIFQEKHDANAVDPDRIEGRRAAIVQAGTDPKTGDARYFGVTVASIKVTSLTGEGRAREVLKRMKHVARSSVVTLGTQRYLRVTSELVGTASDVGANGVSVMLLAIDEGDRQLAIDFSGPKGWRADELEDEAGFAMATFSRPAVTAVPTNPRADAGAALFGGLILLVIVGGPIALIALRIFVRRAIRNHLAAPSYASRGPQQLVGDDCAACSRSIVFEHDGTRCSLCGAGIHRSCAGAHGAAHGQPAFSASRP